MMGHTWKTFLSTVIDISVSALITSISNHNSLIEDSIVKISQETIKKLISWLNSGIEEDVNRILHSWLSTNSKWFMSDSDMIIANVMDCINRLQDLSHDTESTPFLLHIDANLQHAFNQIQQNPQFSDLEKKEISMALQYTVETLLKLIIENSIPEVLMDICRHIEALDNRVQRYSDNLLSLSKRVNYYEYHVQQIENQLHPFDCNSRFSINGFQHIMGLVPPILSTDYNNLHYMNKEMSSILLGRDKEKKSLEDFLASDMHFCFFVIAGAGGIGKSKLVYSLYLDLLRSGHKWRSAFINTTILQKLSECEVWNIDKDTLLIYDYASSSPELLHNCFTNIASAENTFHYKLRIILIDRIGKYENNIKNGNNGISGKIITYPYWYTSIITRGHRENYSDDYLSRYLYKFLNLSKLSRNQNMELVITYAKKVRGCIFSEQQIKSLENFIYNLKNEYSRPLFLLAAADIVIDGQNIEHWNTEQVMSKIYLRDKQLLFNTIQDPFLFVNFQDIIVYATIFGEWNEDCDFSILDGSVLLNIERATRTHDKIILSDWIRTINVSNNVQATQKRINAYEPDILGEYFVLEQLSFGKKVLEKWCDLIYYNLSKAVPFIKRRGQDYSETSKAEVINSILQNLAAREYYHRDKAEIIIDLCFNLLRQKSINKAAKETIVIIVRKSNTAFHALERLIRENYSNLEIKTTKDRLIILNELEFFYEHCRFSHQIIIKYLELLGYLTYTYYRKSTLSQNNQMKFISQARQYKSKIFSIYKTQNIFEEEFESTYIEAMSRTLSGLINARCYDEAVELIDLVNTSTSCVHFQQAAIKYLDLYCVIIKNRDHCHHWFQFTQIIQQFSNNISRWAPNIGWTRYALSFASIIPGIIEGLFRVQEYDFVNHLSLEYIKYYATYIKSTSMLDCSNWLWVRRFETGINRICKFFPEILIMMEHFESI